MALIVWLCSDTDAAGASVGTGTGAAGASVGAGASAAGASMSAGTCAADCQCQCCPSTNSMRRLPLAFLIGH